jgi:hypothetical protein
MGVAILAGAIVALLAASAANAGHWRPKGATPQFDSFVIAYHPCFAGGGPPFRGGAVPAPACAPPAKVSPWLEVGEPTVNGLAAAFIGSSRLDVCPVAGCPPAPDIKVAISLTDIRCTAALAGATPAVCPAGALGGYTGSVAVNYPFQDSGHCTVAVALAACPAGIPPPPGGPPSTAAFIPFKVIVPCAIPGLGLGSTCALVTSFNTVLPGLIPGPAGQRMNIQLDAVTVDDGGMDGSAATPADNVLFATEGVFVP